MPARPYPAQTRPSYLKFAGCQPSLGGGWLLCCLVVCLLWGAVSIRDLAGQESLAPTSFSTRFHLAAIGTDRWCSVSDFSGRPLIVIHFASGSVAARRMLPLWQQRLQPIVSAGTAHVIAIAHEQHAGRAALLCEELGWTGLLLHDPLGETLNPQGSTDYPWASILDAEGNVAQARVTLAELNAKTLALISQTTPVDSHQVETVPARSTQEHPSRAALLQDLRDGRAASASFPTLEPVADQLLRLAFDSTPEQADEVLLPIMDFYREAMHHTEDGRWAFRLAVAFRLAFDFSVAAKRTDTSLWQQSLEHLQLANRTAAVSPVWRERLEQYRPSIDQKSAPYAWLEERLHKVSVPPTGRWTGPIALGLPLFAFESGSAGLLHQPGAVEPADWPRATPVPPASIRVQPVWISSRPADGQGRWARLLLHVQLKRGEWSLEAEPRFQWSVSDSELPNRASPRVPIVHVAKELPEPNEPKTSADSVSAVWLEMELPVPDTLVSEAGSPAGGAPRRNARLLFQGRDPLTGKMEWREAEFYLPAPQRLRVDW